MKKIYKIEGMHCASCAMNIEKSVRKLKNVKSTSVNFAVKKLYVDSDKEINDEEIKKLIITLGIYQETKPFKMKLKLGHRKNEVSLIFKIRLRLQVLWAL